MDRPYCLIIAGPNGAGKTTLTRSMRSRNVDFGEYINPDDIARRLEGSYDERVIAAQRTADELRDACIAEKRSFSFETVMSHSSKIEVLLRAKEAGFATQLFFVGTDDPQTNIERVRLRVKQGEHDVPTEKIVSRWNRTMELLCEAIRSVDATYVFDNSVAGVVENAPRLVFRRVVLNGRNLPLSEQYPPVPLWVERFVLQPLGIAASGFHSVLAEVDFKNSSTITAPFDAELPHSIFSNRPFRKYPYSIELEQVVMGALLRNPDLVKEISEVLESHHFFEPIHQKIFELLRELSSSTDAASEIEEMLPVEFTSEVSTREYLAKLIAEVPVDWRMRLSELVSEVRDLAFRRALILAAEDIATSAEDTEKTQTHALIKEAERRLSEVGEAAYYEGGLQSASQALLSTIDKAAQAFIDTSGAVSTGFRTADRMLGGLQGGNLIVVASRPSIGKTSFGVNIAYNVARSWHGEVNSNGQLQTRSGGVAGLFSLEMSSEQITTRLIAAAANIPSDLIFSGRISERDFDKLKDSAVELNSIPLFIDDSGGLSVERLASRARRLKARKGLDLLVIDNYQVLLRSSEISGIAKSKKTLRVSAALKELARDLLVPIVVISQLPSARNYRDRRPQINDLDRFLEQDADVVLLVHREDHYLNARRPDESDRHGFAEWMMEMDREGGRSELIIAKNRHGPTGVINLWFDASVSRFGDLSDV